MLPGALPPDRDGALVGGNATDAASRLRSHSGPFPSIPRKNAQCSECTQTFELRIRPKSIAATWPSRKRSARSSAVNGRIVVYRDTEDHQRDARQVAGGRDLPEDDQANDGGRGGQQREHQGEGGARQPGHGELVGDVGNDRGGQADADAPQQPRVPGERRGGRADAKRGGWGAPCSSREPGPLVIQFGLRHAMVVVIATTIAWDHGPGAYRAGPGARDGRGQGGAPPGAPRLAGRRNSRHFGTSP